MRKIVLIAFMAFAVIGISHAAPKGSVPVDPCDGCSAPPPTQGHSPPAPVPPEAYTANYAAGYAASHGVSVTATALDEAVDCGTEDGGTIDGDDEVVCTVDLYPLLNLVIECDCPIQYPPNGQSGPGVPDCSDSRAGCDAFGESPQGG